MDTLQLEVLNWKVFSALKRRSTFFQTYVFQSRKKRYSKWKQCWFKHYLTYNTYYKLKLLKRCIKLISLNDSHFTSENFVKWHFLKWHSLLWNVFCSLAHYILYTDFDTTVLTVWLYNRWLCKKWVRLYWNTYYYY